MQVASNSCIWKGLNLFYLQISGVFSVGGKLSRIVMRKTVIESKAEMPSVTFSPESDGTKNTNRAEMQYEIFKNITKYSV